jgi:hypothetical protein
MKAMIATALFTLAAAGVADAQGIVEVDDLRAPTSPAFALLDVTPASVNRPENPKAFTLNVINAIAQSNGFPQNYALEVAPYWLVSHPDLTFKQYQHPGVAASIRQTLAFSVATTPIKPAAGSAANSAGTRLGIGIRMNIATGRPNPALESLVKELEALNGVILDKIANGQDFETDRKDAESKALEIQAIDGQRLGFLLAAAAGETWSVPSDDFNLVERGRWGVWVTPAYRFRGCEPTKVECVALFDAIGVVRLLDEPNRDALWDFGGRFLWQPTKELSLSAEVLRRRGAGMTPTSQRTSAILEYRIGQDLLLYGSFGRDFERDTGKKPLVSIIGLNIGFGKRALVKPITQ